MVELAGFEPASKNILFTTNLILTLYVLVISFYPIFLPNNNLKNRFYYTVTLLNFLIEKVFKKSSLEVNKTMLSLEAY